jgi:threonine synthase
MKYYSTNKQAPIANLSKAVVKGLAEDRGLYMPERINKLPKEFFDNIEKLSFQEIAYRVADAFFGEDVEAEALKKIVYDTLAFDCPVVKRQYLFARTLPRPYARIQGRGCAFHGTNAPIHRIT